MRLATRTWGEPGRPAVVLVHGLTSTGRTWWRVGPALAAGGRFVVAIDLRGHGASGGATPETTLDDLAADVLETVDTVVAQGPVDIVGHSLGALTALRAAGMSDRFRRVVAEDPADQDVRLEVVADDVLASAALAHADPDRFHADVRAENPAWPEQDIQHELLGHQELEAEPVAEAIRHFRFDLLELLESAQAPLLLVVGAEERDSRLTGETRREALNRFPASEHDAGHVVHRDDYDGYVGTVSSFLDCPD